MPHWPGAGRPKGGANKLNDEARAKALDGGTTPLEYLLAVMRDTGLDRDTRIDAAKAAAPYVHARLAAVEHSGDKDKPIAHTVTWQE